MCAENVVIPNVAKVSPNLKGVLHAHRKLSGGAPPEGASERRIESYVELIDGEWRTMCQPIYTTYPIGRMDDDEEEEQQEVKVEQVVKVEPVAPKPVNRSRRKIRVFRGDEEEDTNDLPKLQDDMPQWE